MKSAHKIATARTSIAIPFVIKLAIPPIIKISNKPLVKELINSLNWFHQNRNSSSIIEKENLVIINAEDNVRDTIIGTITSIISKSNLYNEGTILISLAHTLEEDTKISIRSVGKNNLNLKEILSNIVEKLNCKAGGHVNAAGSIIPQEKEQEFINLAQKILLENFIKPL